MPRLFGGTISAILIIREKAATHLHIQIIASYSGIAPLEARGSISLRPLEIDCKESLFPAVPKLLNEVWLSDPDPGLKRDQRSTGEGGMCFAVCQHI